MIWPLAIEKTEKIRLRLRSLTLSQLDEVWRCFGEDDHRSSRNSRTQDSVELVDIARQNEGSWNRLLQCLDTLVPVRLGEDGSFLLLPRDIEALQGILCNHWHGESIALVKFAYMLTLNSLVPDREYQSLTHQSLVESLCILGPKVGEKPSIARFAVYLRDLAERKQVERLSLQLESWLNALFVGTDLSIDIIRAGSIVLPDECLWHPYIEFGWLEGNPHCGQAFVRWGPLRNRMEISGADDNRRSQIHSTSRELASHPTYKDIPIDHIEVTATWDDFVEPWEFGPDSNPSDTQVTLIHDFWPVIVRLCGTCNPNDNRFVPSRPISSEDFGTHDDVDELNIHAVTKGCVCVCNHIDAGKPTVAVRIAAQSASLLIWTRVATNAQKVIQGLANTRIFDMPGRLHRLRRTSMQNRSPWRDVVMLYEPNLPRFKFDTDESERTLPKTVGTSEVPSVFLQYQKRNSLL